MSGRPGDLPVPEVVRRSGAAPEGSEQAREARRGARTPKTVTVGLLASPGVVYELALDLARELPGLLRRRFPALEWKIEVLAEPMAAASDDDVDLVEIAHRRLLAKGWQLAVCLTDFPIHIGSRPVTAYASPTHGVGLVSVPALGAVNLDERVRTAVMNLIEGLLGETVDDQDAADDPERERRMLGRLQELASGLGRAEVHEGRHDIRFVSAVWRGNLRLLIGMVRANRPWRLVAGLSRAIVGALGLDIFGVASPGVWILADGLSWWRLALVALASVIATGASLIMAHGLWQKSHSPKPEARERVALFNLATALTVAIGIVTLFLALFAINVVVAGVLVTTGVLRKQLGHAVDVVDYVVLAAVVSSLATLGGALGAALENDRAVREAAYGYRPDARTEADDGGDGSESDGRTAPRLPGEPAAGEGLPTPSD